MYIYINISSIYSGLFKYYCIMYILTLVLWLYYVYTIVFDHMSLKLPASRLFALAFVQAQIKDNIRALRHWPLWGESTGHWWIPITKRQ